MKIYEDKYTKLKYVYFEDILDENVEPDEITRLLINGIIKDHLNTLTRKIISLNGEISLLKSGFITHDEAVVAKSKLSDLYFDLDLDLFDSNNKNGFWKYIDSRFSFKDLYDEAIENPVMQFSEIFEDENFLKNMMQIKGDRVI